MLRHGAGDVAGTIGDRRRRTEAPLRGVSASGEEERLYHVLSPPASRRKQREERAKPVWSGGAIMDPCETAQRTCG